MLEQLECPQTIFSNNVFSEVVINQLFHVHVRLYMFIRVTKTCHMQKLVGKR